MKARWDESQEPQSAARLQALMEWEQKAVAALQHVLQVAARQGIPVPPVVVQVASPLLLKFYGLTDAADVLLAALDQIKASPYQEELLSKALSDAAEVEALLEAKEYELALQAVHDQPASTGNVGRLGLIYPLYVEKLLADDRPEEALAQAEAFLDRLPEHAQAEPLLARAATAWAEAVLDRDTCAEVGLRLFAVKKRLSHVPPEFKFVLSAACAEFAATQFRVDNLDKAIEYFEYSLKYNEHNRQAQRGLALIYHNQAMEKAMQSSRRGVQTGPNSHEARGRSGYRRLLVLIVTNQVRQMFREGRIRQGTELLPMSLNTYGFAATENYIQVWLAPSQIRS